MAAALRLRGAGAASAVVLDVRGLVLSMLSASVGSWLAAAALRRVTRLLELMSMSVGDEEWWWVVGVVERELPWAQVEHAWAVHTRVRRMRSGRRGGGC